MDVKYQIFVSSTFEDLRAERSAVIEQILNLQHIPVGMESFNAADDTQWNYIKRRIDRSDYYLVIIAERYGSIEEASGKSYTQKEYEYAIEQGKPVVAFLLDKASRQNWPRDKVEFDRQDKVEDFRQLCQGRLVKFWRNADHLGGLVSTSLSELMVDRPGVGWIRGDSVPSNVLSEIATLSQENRELKEIVRKLGEATSGELNIPADASIRLSTLEGEKVRVASRVTKEVRDTEKSVLDAFLFLRKRFAVGLSQSAIERAFRSNFLLIDEQEYLLADEIIADLSASNLIHATIEQINMFNEIHHNKNWYLTEYGKTFILFAQEWRNNKVDPDLSGEK